MTKKSFLWILLDLIFVAAFNAIFFVVTGTQHETSVWISYELLNFAYLMLLITPFLNEKSSIRYIFGATIYSISSVYFLLELGMTVANIILEYNKKNIGFNAWFIIQIIVTAIFLVVLLGNLIANNTTAQSVERHENEVAFIKTASTKIKLLQNQVTDKTLNKQMEKLYDLVHSSPSHSNLQAKPVETTILQSINSLSNEISDENAALESVKKIISLVNERNAMI